MEAMPYALPTDVDERPVTVIGGGTLGRRIAMMFAAGGSRVRLFSRSADSREAARRFVARHGRALRRADARGGHGVAHRRIGVRGPCAQAAGLPRPTRSLRRTRRRIPAVA